MKLTKEQKYLLLNYVDYLLKYNQERERMFDYTQDKDYMEKFLLRLYRKLKKD